MAANFNVTKQENSHHFKKLMGWLPLTQTQEGLKWPKKRRHEEKPSIPQLRHPPNTERTSCRIVKHLFLSSTTFMTMPPLPLISGAKSWSVRNQRKDMRSGYHPTNNISSGHETLRYHKFQGLLSLPKECLSKTSEEYYLELVCGREWKWAWPASSSLEKESIRFEIKNLRCTYHQEIFSFYL